MKRTNKKYLIGLMGLGLSLAASVAFASPELERVYLLQMKHQIEAIKTTLIAAKKEQNPEARVVFHYTSYRDAKGLWHNGLLEDLEQMETGIQEKLEGVSIEPRTVPPIAGDYEEAVEAEENLSP